MGRRKGKAKLALPEKRRRNLLGIVQGDGKAERPVLFFEETSHESP